MTSSTLWKLKRTAQCAKCPWRKDVNPRDILGGYSEEKHRDLADTIAPPGDEFGHALAVLSGREPMRIFACHETKDAYCVGWLMHQLGPGNNILLRMSMRSCSNAGRVRLVGDQHARFEDTLPVSAEGE